jgi:hypothetical protein
VSAVSTIAAASYKRKVAMANAEVAEQNAETSMFESRAAAQDQDLDAAQSLGAMLANQGASGLSLGIGSQGLAMSSQRALAARDRGYTIHEGKTKHRNFLQQRNDSLAEAAGAKSEMIFGAVSGALGIGDSIISGAASKNNAKFLAGAA